MNGQLLCCCNGQFCTSASDCGAGSASSPPPPPSPSPPVQVGRFDMIINGGANLPNKDLAFDQTDAYVILIRDVASDKSGGTECA
eukprot:1196640-Prymnesium_polylepis.1